ncbi:ribosome recycling factor [Candidatus Wolfebacteria bacterium]|nr:ribosome recycling factor [Candidatus Wolfebacteria bacterium]
METLKELEVKLKHFIDALKAEFLTVRSNRPSPRMVEDIPVEAYGQKMTVKQLGAISVVPPSQIQITVWDKSAVNAVAKAVESSNLKVSANIDGAVIRINLPPLSDERRKEFEKMVKKQAEETKIKVRSLRDEINKKITRDFEDKKISEDDKFNFKEKVQKEVDKANGEIEKILEMKIKEINE